MICNRSGCEREATHAVNLRQRYCSFHKKVLNSIICAKRRGKSVLPFSEIESLFLNTKNCRGCGVSLDPFLRIVKGSPRANAPTLQHDRNGSLSVLCLSCNISEGKSKIGEMFLDLVGEKSCPVCEMVLSHDSFYVFKSGENVGKLYPICKACSRAKCKRSHLSRNRTSTQR